VRRNNGNSLVYFIFICGIADVGNTTLDLKLKGEY
tara:strand:+ start:277 stop:381 length:105 start_codon:yes stop_codon:yes gene_type:complete